MEKKTPQEELYEMLIGQRKIAEDRSNALTERASGLSGFAGIINTVLIVIIMSVLDATKIALLKDSPYFPCLRWVVILSFTFYIASTIFALLAYEVTKYFPAPRIESVEFIEALFDAKPETKLSKRHFSIQLYDAIQFFNEVNRKKFNYLLAGSLCLTIAIVLTAITGMFLFVSIG